MKHFVSKSYVWTNFYNEGVGMDFHFSLRKFYTEKFAVLGNFHSHKIFENSLKLTKWSTIVKRRIFLSAITALKMFSLKWNKWRNHFTNGPGIKLLYCHFFNLRIQSSSLFGASKIQKRKISEFRILACEKFKNKIQKKCK